MRQAAAALAAIPASGEWWVAPWECPLEFGRLLVRHTSLDPNDTWDALRDAHLKDIGTGS